MKKIGLVLALAGATALTASAALFQDSFEGGINTSVWDTTIEPTAVYTTVNGNGVTDGTDAVKIDHTDVQGEVGLLRITHGSSPAFFAALKDPTATGISIDFFATTPLTDASWSQVGLRLEGSDGTYNVTAPFVRYGVDQQLTATLDFAAQGIDYTAATWAQVTVVFNAAANSARTPIILDNFQVIPEPATFGLMGLAALGLIAARRFKM